MISPFCCEAKATRRLTSFGSSPSLARAAHAPCNDGAQLSAGIFYLDLHDIARRAALFTAALTGRLPSGDALKTEYARALARITDSELNTEEGSRVVDEGALLEASRSKRLVDDSVERSAYRAEARARTAPDRGVLARTAPRQHYCPA